ncbi:MAG: DUF4832 domain-containing protein [Gemmatimonadaceae bacterium]|nr:DUF4832 domain-containing protein [Gemmatimonadaceae bacterium]
MIRLPSPRVLPVMATALLCACAVAAPDAPLPVSDAEPVVGLASDATALLVASDSNVPNPDRGFYIQRFGRYPERPDWVWIDANDFRQARDSGMSVVRVYYLLSDFRDRALSASVIDSVTRVFTTARAAGMRVIPRFAYNFGDGPDAPVAVVLQHIDQLGPVLRANADVIAFIEAGFIGWWGEWHTSTNGLIGPGQQVNANTRAILERELAAFPASRMLAVRTPWQKRQLLGSASLSPTEAFTGTPRARVGAHNDCFLASTTDWGTYSSEDPRVIDEEKTFLNQDNRYLPQGGETCNEGADAQPYIGCTNALVDLVRIRFSVLNEGYHPGVNQRWRNEGCMADVQRRLGYRFRLTRVATSNGVRTGGRFRVTWSVRNDGFAAPYNPRDVAVVLRNVVTGVETRLPLPHDPRRWLPGQDIALDDTLALPSTVERGTYAVLLHLGDPDPALRRRPEYAIRLANDGLWEPSTGYHLLVRRFAVR